jgi:predicted  nucleic acid-binding Zn-ribbon protein
MATKRTNGDSNELVIAVLERIEAQAKETNRRLGQTNERLGRVEMRLEETNERLGRVETRLEGVETQAKRTNKRLGGLEKRLTTMEVPAMAALEERVGRLESAVFKTAAE